MCLYFLGVKGKVFSGEGKASEFLRIDEYSDFVEQEAGFEPFPGTLNLRADPQEINKIKDQAEKAELEGFEKDGNEFGGLKLFLIKVEGLKSCIIEPELSRYGENVIEVCNSLKLRSKLDLADGDRVEVIAEP
jgi:riboflavin kinase